MGFQDWTTWMLSAPGKLSQDSTLQSIYTQHTRGRLFVISSFTCSVRLQTLYDVPKDSTEVRQCHTYVLLRGKLKKKRFTKIIQHKELLEYYCKVVFFKPWKLLLAKCCNPHYMKNNLGFITSNPCIQAKAFKKPNRSTPHLLHLNRNSAFLSLAYV